MKPRSVILLLLCLGLMRVPAQDPTAPTPPPEELVQFRRSFELQSLTRAQTLSVQYSNALANVIKEAAAEGDYDQALAAQRRRDQLIALYSRSLDETILSDVIVFRPGDARVNGGVTFDRNANALVWKTIGAVATWDVPKITPGAYEVTLTYAAADIGELGRFNPSASFPDLRTGGDIEFYEDSSLSGAEQNRRPGKVASTGGWTNWATITLPAIQITRTPARFALKVTKTNGTSGVMNLKSIRLAPPAPPSATPPVDPLGNPQDAGNATVDEFTKLQQAHLDHLRQAITPIVNTYTDSMKALAAKYVISDLQAAEEYNTEAQRAAQIIDEPQNILIGPAKGPRQGSNIEGFHEMPNVTFVPTDQNTGDCFKVRQGTEEFFVRLLWVSCPPAVGEDVKLTKEIADYFGIGVEDVRAVGTQASEFTSSFLSGKTLTLLTRGIKDQNGNLLVAVRPDRVGDFAGVLVDHGLAMIRPPQARKGPPRRHEESILHGLQERENAAKAKAIPTGAWARRKSE